MPGRAVSSISCSTKGHDAADALEGGDVVFGFDGHGRVLDGVVSADAGEGAGKDGHLGDALEQAAPVSQAGDVDGKMKPKIRTCRGRGASRGPAPASQKRPSRAHSWRRR